MNVTFRQATPNDVKQLQEVGVSEAVLNQLLRPRGSWDERRAHVVTINGCVIIAWNKSGEIVYQDGSDAVPELVRAQGRVSRALGKLFSDDFRRIKRKGKPEQSLADILGGFG